MGVGLIVTLEQMLLFGTASAVVTAAPGPDNLATLGIGLSRGRQAAMAFGAGCSLGCLTHTLWAAIGMTAVLAASTVAFTVFKFLGACYLFYLSVVILRSGGSAAPRDAEGDTSIGRYLLRGFIANAINPKVALFFLAFLPQFVRAGNVAVQMVLLGVSFAVLTAIAFMTLGYFSGEIGAWLRARPHVGRRLNQLTGALFIGLGIRLLLQRR
jgi:threonine/homoserine/homoserine lactone efflux protein